MLLLLQSVCLYVVVSLSVVTLAMSHEIVGLSAWHQSFYKLGSMLIRVGKGNNSSTNETSYISG